MRRPRQWRYPSAQVLAIVRSDGAPLAFSQASAEAVHATAPVVELGLSIALGLGVLLVGVGGQIEALGALRSGDQLVLATAQGASQRSAEDGAPQPDLGL